jgi:hypothetical protein
MTKRYALRDDQWEQIKDLLLGRMGTDPRQYCGQPIPLNS